MLKSRKENLQMLQPSESEDWIQREQDLMPNVSVTPNEVMSILNGCRFRFNDETDLQDGIALALGKAGIRYEREKILGPLDRPDFLLESHIVLEIKIKGSLADALRQINRYTKHEAVRSVLLVGTPSWLYRAPAEIGNKPVFSLRLTGSLL
jgi:hypothetical protein